MAEVTTNSDSCKLSEPMMTSIQGLGTGDLKFKKIGHFLVGPRFVESSFGEMRLAVHIGTREKVAIKVVPKRVLVQVSEAQRHFRREVLLLQRVRHPNIVRFYGTMESSTCYYLVHELIMGGHLLGRVAVSGCLSEGDSQHYMRQMTSAVDHLHKFDIVHRNLKLESFLLDQGNNIKLVGFGLSAICRSHDLQLSTQCISPLYAAPELFAGKKYGKPVDIWSLGVCMFAMLMGRLPFFPGAGSSLVELRELILKGCRLPSFLTSECSNLLAKMLEPMDGKRITSNAIVAHAWLASTTCSRQHQRSDINSSLTYSSLAKSDGKECDVTNHQKPASEKISDSQSEDCEGFNSKENVKDELEEETFNSSGKLFNMDEDCPIESAISEKEQIASRLSSQLSACLSSIGSYRTQSGKTAQTSSSYKSNILRLKRLRQDLVSDKAPGSGLIKSQCSLFGRHPRLFSLSDNVKGLQDQTRNTRSKSHTLRQAIINPENNVSADLEHDTSRDIHFYNHLLVEGRSYSRQHSASTRLTPIYRYSTSSRKKHTQSNLTEQMSIQSTVNTDLPSETLTTSLILEAPNNQDNRNSMENEFHASKIDHVYTGGLENFPINLQGETTPCVKKLPRVCMLRDPFSRDVWNKNIDNMKSCRMKHQLSSIDGSHNSQRHRRRWAPAEPIGRWGSKMLAENAQSKNIETSSFPGHLYRADDNCDQISGGFLPDKSNSHRPHGNLCKEDTKNIDLTGLCESRRELTGSPRTDLEDFLTPVTRVVIIHS